MERTILTPEAAEELVRELSEHKRTFCPFRLFARGAGPWPPRPVTWRNVDQEAAEARDRAAVLSPFEQPAGRHTGWTHNVGSR